MTQPEKRESSTQSAEPGLLLALEGVDGSGKSTQTRLLAEGLRAMGLEVEPISFPRYEDPIFGDLIRRFLSGELGPVDQVHPRLVALLFAGDRGAEAPNLRGALADGKIVICDRYFYSNVAYQGAKLEAGDEIESFERWLRELEFGHYAIPVPACSLYLDVRQDQREERLAERVASSTAASEGAVTNDIHERDLALQAKVEEIFRAQSAARDDLVRVDCQDGETALTADEVHAKIVGVLQENGLIQASAVTS